MNKLIACIFFCFITLTNLAQNRQDYIWLMGHDYNNTGEVESIMFNFNNVPFIPEFRFGGLEFDQNNASICDDDGNLLFYTNGCAVANRHHEIMENGDSINAGNYFDVLWLGDCGFGYPGRQDITILPDPGYEDGYYIIHKTREYDPDNIPSTFNKYIKYSYVDLSKNGGLGKVEEKNVIFYEGQPLWSYLSVIGHSNGFDWWMVAPDEGSNLFHIFLVSSAGISLEHSLDLGFSFHPMYSSAAGDAKFSPDGTLYGYYNKTNGFWLFDFDRSTGLITNGRSLHQAPINDPLFSTMEFSPNSKLAYLATHDSLWQVDLSVEPMDEGLQLIDVWNGVVDPFPTTFFMSALAPDCRIYIRSGSGTNSFHMINKPNEKGVACDFRQQYVQLPQVSTTGSWPNFPRWRVDEDEKCDPGITSMFGELVYYRQDLHLYPNPAVSRTTIQLPESAKGYLRVVNLAGQVMLQEKLDYGSAEYTISIDGYPTGQYKVEFLPEQNPDRHIYVAWLSVVR